MSFRVTHDLHRRRFTRNMAVGLALVGFILFAYGGIVYQGTRNAFKTPVVEESQ